MTKISIYVEKAPYQIERAVSIVNNVETDDEGYSIYWDRQTAKMAIAMLASCLGEVVTIDGEAIDLEL